MSAANGAAAPTTAVMAAAAGDRVGSRWRRAHRASQRNIRLPR
ncbi:hypothetical protein [Mycobacterium sp.]